MIVGVGTDIVQIARLRAVLARTGVRFARKVLGPQEWAEFEARSQQHESRALHFLAKRFAAKEAFCKALGTGFRAPMSWHGLQILNNPQGRPEPHYGRALHDYLAQRNWRAHIALSDEAEYALAFVTLEQIDSSGAHHGTNQPNHANNDSNNDSNNNGNNDSNNSNNSNNNGNGDGNDDPSASPAASPAKRG